MKFRDFINQDTHINEGEMRYQALAMAKEVHSQLADLTFVEMLSVMNPNNPAKKEVQELEKKLNDLTREVGDFVIKYMPDVAGSEADEVDEIPAEEEESDKKSDNKNKVGEK